MLTLPNLRHSWKAGQALAEDSYFFDDFHAGGYCPDLALTSESDPAAKFSEVADRGEWLVTRDAAPTIVIADAEPNGLLLVTTGSNAADFVSCQMNGTPWALHARREIYFDWRVKFDDANDTRWLVGLASADVTGSTLGPLLDGTNDFIGFRQAGATATRIMAVTEDDTTETETDTGVDVTDDGFVRLSCWIDRHDQAVFFINGTEVARHKANLPDVGAGLTLSFEVQSPTASSTIEIDYVGCLQTRHV